MSTTDHVPLRRLWLAILCGYLALGATLQQLPGYLVDRFDAGSVEVGTVVAIAFLATALARPFAGRAGDLGFSRSVATVGAAVVAIAAVGHLLAPTIGLLVLARLAMGAGEGALFSATLPWVMSSTPADRRGRVAGWFGLSMWSGLSLGPLIAVAARHLGGDDAVWSAVIALPMASLVLMMSTRRQARPTQWRSIFAARPRDLVPSGIGRPAVCLGLSAYGYGTLTALLILYLTTEGLGGQSVVLSIYAIAFLVARTIGSPLVDRWGATRIAAGTLAVQTLGLVLVFSASTTTVVLLGVIVTGVGVGSIYPAASAMTLHRTDAVAPGAAMGSMTSLWDLGILVAGPVGGLIAAHTGFRWVFVVAACAALTASLVAAQQLIRPDRVRRPAPTVLSPDRRR